MVRWDSGPRAVITNNGGTSTPSHTWHLRPGTCRHSCPLNPELLFSLDPLESSGGEARESPSSVLEFLAVGSCSPVHWKPQDITHPASSQWVLFIILTWTLLYLHELSGLKSVTIKKFHWSSNNKGFCGHTEHLLSTNCKIPPKATTLKIAHTSLMW